MCRRILTPLRLTTFENIVSKGEIDIFSTKNSTLFNNYTIIYRTFHISCGRFVICGMVNVNYTKEEMVNNPYNLSF